MCVCGTVPILSEQESAVLGRKVPLVVLLLHELSRVLSVHSTDSGTQTVVDCVDHRLALGATGSSLSHTFVAE